MFEEHTFEYELERMLDNVPDSLDKREGSIIYDALAPVALEVSEMYSDMDALIDETFADSASYYYLIKRAAERGIFVKEGTAAVLKCQAVPDSVSIPIGTEFNVGDLNYTVTADQGGGIYLLTCEESGTAGNNTSADVIPMENVDGLEEMNVLALYAAGTEDEDEDTLRERYFSSFEAAAYSGNQAAYKETILEQDGVGAVKVFPCWNGGGTVKCMILNSADGVPDASIVRAVQEKIDPTQDGTGVGLAPIGHVVTITGATAQEINVAVSLEYDSGYSWEDVSASVRDAIERHLADLRKDWQNTDKIAVRKSQIESLCLNITGVADVLSVLLNGASANVTVPGEKIPVLGGVTNG